MTIYFLSPSPTAVAGGVQKIYRFAECLQEAGLPSVVVHPNGQARPEWARQSDVPVLSTRRLHAEETDVLVIPEKYAWRLRDQAPLTTKVILCQNPYYMFDGADQVPSERSPYHEPSVAGVVVVSEDSLQYVTFALPGIRAHRVRLGVNTQIYLPLPKRRQIAFMPRRRRDLARQVLGLAAGHGALKGWEVCAVDGVAPEQAARLMGESSIFLSLPHEEGEGFGLPAIEAMACGCLVVGYSGGGGHEYFRREHSFEVAPGDVTGFARGLISALNDERRREDMGRRARAFVAENYRPEQERGDVVDAFRAMRPAASARGGAVDMSPIARPSLVRRVGYRLRHLLD